jgi:predicted nucleotidyltransferase
VTAAPKRTSHRLNGSDVHVFGSIARGDDHGNSEVDLLVDVEPGRTLLDVIAFEQAVQPLLDET